MKLNIFSLIIILTTIFTIKIKTETTNLKQGHAWRKRAFSWIYEKHFWCKDETTPLSGVGSTLESTETIRVLLPSIIKSLNAKSILDAGCGDFTWMQAIKLDIEKYIGIDIVDTVIKENKQKYENSTYTFHCADITSDSIDKVDVIICRDCLFHLSYQDIVDTIKNFKKSGSKYLLATTVPKLTLNDKDITSGNFRPINLMAYPFNFPQPIMLFKELSAQLDSKGLEKWVGLWRLDNIDI